MQLTSTLAYTSWHNIFPEEFALCSISLGEDKTEGRGAPSSGSVA